MIRIQKGFTLIELMIVVAIIGILAAVAVPQYENYVVRADIAETISQASVYKIPISEYYMVMAEMPSDATTGGFADINTMQAGRVWQASYHYESASESIIRIIRTNYDDDGNAEQGYGIDLKATGSSDGVTFVCSSAAERGISWDQLPSTCR